MGKRGDGYGSEDHLSTYLRLQRSALDDAIRRAAGLSGAIEWIYPASGTTKEPKGVSFLVGRPDVQGACRKFWPQTGNQQRWDGVARCGDEWLLIEAKANHPEFCTPPCGAKADGRKKIEKALSEVKVARSMCIGTSPGSAATTSSRDDRPYSLAARLDLHYRLLTQPGKSVGGGSCSVV